MLRLTDSDATSLTWLDAPELDVLSVHRVPLRRGLEHPFSELSHLWLRATASETLAGWDCPSLRFLMLQSCDELQSLDGLGGGGVIATMTIDDCPRPLDLGALADFGRLTTLQVTNSGVHTVEPLRGLPIEALNLSYSYDIEDLAPLRDLPNLGQLVAYGLEEKVQEAGLGHLLQQS